MNLSSAPIRVPSFIDVELTGDDISVTSFGDSMNNLDNNFITDTSESDASYEELDDMKKMIREMREMKNSPLLYQMCWFDAAVSKAHLKTIQEEQKTTGNSQYQQQTQFRQQPHPLTSSSASPRNVSMAAKYCQECDSPFSLSPPELPKQSVSTKRDMSLLPSLPL